jgi:Na+/H+-dicarboxylate symporter
MAFSMKKVFKGTTGKIFLALILGIVVGLLLKLIPVGQEYIGSIFIEDICYFVGNGFIRLIQMTVVPLVFFSLVCGISSFGDVRTLGRIGAKVISFFLISTAVAVVLALIFGFVFQPGSGLDMSDVSEAASQYEVAETEETSMVENFLNMIPKNPVEAMANGEMMQVIVFSCFMGLAFSLMGKKAEPLVKFFNVCNDCIMKIVAMVMWFAPIGVFALITRTMYNTGADALVSIMKFVLIVLVAMLFHAFIIYGGCLKAVGLKIKPFMSAYSRVAGVTFSTASSNAALPFSMQAMDDIGVSKPVYTFTLPLGATVNMNGTSIMQGLAVVFIAQVYGVELTIPVMLSVILTAVMASIGTAGVPGVGMITLSMVVASAGLPLEGIALIMGFDRILDMMRTTVNVMGDCVCAAFVSKTEKDLDLDKYNNYTKDKATEVQV